MNAPNQADKLFSAMMGGRSFGASGRIGPASNVIAPAAFHAPLKEWQLHIGDLEPGGPLGLDLLKLIDGRLLIQGVSGAGKSYTIRRLLEQSAGMIQQILIDPEGEFESLATDLGMLHVEGHLLDSPSLALVARRAREGMLSLVLDLSELDREGQLRAVAAFLPPLIDAPREFWRAALVAIDEAHLFAPFGGDSSLGPIRKEAISAVIDLMSRGRKRGLTGILATQRLARLSKSVASEVHNFLVGMNTLDLDIRRAAETIGWDARRAFDRLPLLTPGQFVAVGPAFSEQPAQCKIGACRSRHIGAAPAIVAPPKLAPSEARAMLQLDGLIEGSVIAPPARPLKHPGSRGSTYDAAQDAIIRAGFARSATMAEIVGDLVAAGHPKRSISGVTVRAQSLGLVNPRGFSTYSDEENEIITEGYRAGDRIADIVRNLAAKGYVRGFQAVQMHAIHLGISGNRVKYWTPEETRIALASLMAGNSHATTIRLLKEAGYERGVNSIHKFAQKHGIDRSLEGWTPAEHDELRKCYAEKMPCPEIAKRIGKTVGAVRTEASRLGLRQRVAWTDEEKRALIAACQDGLTLVAAAEKIGKPYMLTARVAGTLGLSFRKTTRTT